MSKKRVQTPARPLQTVFKSTPHTPTPVSKSKALVWLSAILLLTLISYFPALNKHFTNWDDDVYVTKNKTVQNLSADNLKAIFTEYQNGNYHPLTMLSLAVEHSMADLNPIVYHTTNVVLHLLATAFVFVFIFLLSEKLEIAVLCSALFGVHPLHVESVAWISERKDVLYALFFVAALTAYARYVKTSRRNFYYFSLVLFVLSLFSKGQAVTLAISVVLIDLFLGRKIDSEKVIREKIPFFALALIFGIVAVKAQASSKAIFESAAAGYFDRILFAGHGFTNYCIKLLFPYRLSALYPYPAKGNIPLHYWLGLLFGVCYLLLLVKTWKISRQVFFGLAFFLANIITVLQFIPVGNAFKADRYVYIPSIGFFYLVAYSYDHIVQKRPLWGKPLMVTLGAYTLMFSIFTFQRCDVWRDSVTLWTDATSKYPMAEIAWNNLGSANNEREDYKEALQCFSNAYELNPGYALALANRGLVKKNIGDLKGAREDLLKAIQIAPEYESSYYLLGTVELLSGNPGAALRSFEQALRIKQDYADGYWGRATARAQLKDYQGAMADFATAIKLKPEGSEIYDNRGITKAETGDLKGAIADFTKAIELSPDYAGAYLNRAVAYLKLGEKDRACTDFRRSQQFKKKPVNKQMEKYCSSGE